MSDIYEDEIQMMADELTELRVRNRQLERQLAQVMQERCEDQSELARHHDHFEQVSELARCLNLRLVSLSLTGRDIHWTDLDNLRGDYVTPIRNIVG